MTLANIKPSTISLTKGTNTMTTTFTVPAWTFEEIISECEINEKAVQLIANMKAVLTTDELCNEFMNRIEYDPTGVDLNRLTSKMREEQLQLNPMSDESFLDTFMLNPLQALIEYFKHSVVPAHIDRMKQWAIDIRDVMELKKLDNEIHLNEAMQTIYLKQM